MVVANRGTMAMKKIILAAAFSLVISSAYAGLSSMPRDETNANVRDARAEAPTQKRHKPVSFEKQLERTLLKAFSF